MGGAARFVAAVAWRYSSHEGSVLAGNIAFSVMLSLLPFLIFATALAGFFVGPEGTTAALDAMFEALPEHVALTLKPVVLEVIGQRRGGVLTIAALGSIWAASNGVEAVRVALDRAYEGDIRRHFTLNRAFAVGIVLSAMVTLILLGALVVLAPLVFRLLESRMGLVIPTSADVARYAVSTAVLSLFLWKVHRVLPSRRMRGFRLWPGIAATVLALVLAGAAFSQYLALAPNFSVTYGTLGGVVVTLLFFYIGGVALILGAEVNAVANSARLRAPDPED
ncbi:YihY/virulence factor BrkB family protein [Limibaculum sp. FT325]|uniref:YihY/virulence factor BrkB family protein n=1 Tax=Thermohalobaculum sediminis TaxID=2939436 RepID=UPI0020BD7F80|nr:YihY/virulence factor BrkB family protein [Limibaculum sediminis]MCL5777282.1 YihY/virulence factor BrkB family protein [Limibaculum sediminis]